MDRMEKMSALLKEMAENLGATAVGIATNQTLAGGPPSTDLTYALPGARSAVSFALPLNHDHIESFLRKEDPQAHNLDNIRTNTLASGIALDLATYLRMKGYASVPIAANLFYRREAPRGPAEEKPDISHRYLAVRSGVGYFGLSGNVIRPKEGAAIILGSVVTEAELIPTEPLPPAENYCDGCRLCMASCASGLMSPSEDVTVTLGGVSFSYSKRRSYNRCDYVCGGFTGLDRSGKWSTWSPARFPIPEKDEDFLPALRVSAQAYRRRPKLGTMFFHGLMPGSRIQFTCGNCQLVCHPDKTVRQRRHKMLVESGVVVQDPDGVVRAVSPEAAKKHLAAMPAEMRALYEKVD